MTERESDMSQIKGVVKEFPSETSAVESIKVSSPVKYGFDYYAVDVRVKVKAATPADAAMHVQKVVLS